MSDSIVVLVFAGNVGPLLLSSDHLVAEEELAKKMLRTVVAGAYRAYPTCGATAATLIMHRTP
jgi:hypothetical protein